MLTGQRLAGKVREDFARRALLASSSLMHCEQNVVIKVQRGAHASDAIASYGTYQAAMLSWSGASIAKSWCGPGLTAHSE